MNRRYGVTVVEALGYAPNGFLLEASAADGPNGAIALANMYFESGYAEFSHPEFVEERHWRSIAEAPARGRDESMPESRNFLAQQWHRSTAKVIDAWAITRGAPSIKIAILDDGIDTNHREFGGKNARQFDYQSNTADACPKRSDDNHGTACAGVAIAKGLDAYGSAPACTLMAVRTPRIFGSADEARMFQQVCDQGADIISCSWGPTDGTGTEFPLPDNIRAAINYCVTRGRGGKGIPIFWAAGNGSESADVDGYAANPDVMAIAASTSDERQAWYSDFGRCIFVAAPSNGDSNLGQRSIFTTDRTGSSGYNAGDPNRGDAAGNYTNGFGGTSSATPLVAGIAGLILAAKPNLSRDEVRDILKQTADKIGSAGEYDSNGHSTRFGYGRVNALAAVRAASGGSPSGGSSSTAPSISAPASAPRAGAAPTFSVSLGNRRMYAVEVATRRDLLDPNNGSQRSNGNYYGSWADTPLSSAPTFTLGAGVWERLRAAGQLFYRAHFADDSRWTNYVVSATPSSAPSMAITDASDGGTTPTTPATPTDGTPSLTAPNSIERNGSALGFRASLGNRRVYAVEVATQRELLDPSNAGNRNQSNYYASWSDVWLVSTPTFTLGDAVWSRLRQGAALFFRGHFANDNTWSSYFVTAKAGNASSVQITSQGSGGGVVPGGGTTTTPVTVRYPSGATFTSVSSPADGKDYNDPTGNGIVPLIDLRGRENENVSRNFKVSELAASDRARYARISVELVEALQAMRDRLGRAITVVAGYRYPALNAAMEGEERSEHLAGRAADIRAAGVTPLELARVAMETIDTDIGLGLGPSSIHIDLRGTFTTWTYQGASMSSAAFDQWARNIRQSRFGSTNRSFIAKRNL